MNRQLQTGSHRNKFVINYRREVGDLSSYCKVGPPRHSFDRKMVLGTKSEIYFTQKGNGG